MFLDFPNPPRRIASAALACLAALTLLSAALPLSASLA